MLRVSVRRKTIKKTNQKQSKTIKNNQKNAIFHQALRSSVSDVLMTAARFLPLPAAASVALCVRSGDSDGVRLHPFELNHALPNVQLRYNFLNKVRLVEMQSYN